MIEICVNQSLASLLSFAEEGQLALLFSHELLITKIKRSY